MRPTLSTALVLLTACAAFSASLTTPAAAQVAVAFGTTWDGPGQSLQEIVDARYGAGAIDVTNDYIGAQSTDPATVIWNGEGFRNYLIEEVAGYANVNLLGWYIDNDAQPVIDGVDDGVVFSGPHGPGHTTEIAIGDGRHNFGFYLNPNGTGDSRNAPEPEMFFTNRYYNDRGPDGSGAIHAPFDGDVQALVFDVSAFTRPQTWLVCFEDFDSGPNPGPCCATTDNDFNDLVFEVTVNGLLPVQPATFGQIKALFR